MTRREFVAGGASAALAGCMTRSTASGDTRLRLGVISDIHVTTEAFVHDEHDRVCLSTAEMYERALRYFRERGVDAVAIAGDLTEYGMVGELERVGEIWQKVFPGNCGKDGEKVEKLFILGNHDAIAWGWKSTYYGGFWKGAERAEKWSRSIARDPAAAWRAIFDEPYAPLEIRDVKGYKFILGHWPPGDPAKGKWSAGAEVPGLAEFLETHRGELACSRPFFYIQHAHPKGTCLPFAATDRGGATAALSKFPNAVAFSGHAHQPLTDERGFWHGAFVSIGTASLIDAGGRSYRENGSPFASGAVDDPRKVFLNTNECRQGLYVTVADDRLTFERRDFTWGLPVGPDWTVPETARAEPPPAFPRNTNLSVAVTERGIRLEFPSANAGGRTYDYEAQAILLADDYESAVASRRVLAPDYHLPPAKADRPGTVHFAREALPQGARIRFEVRPADCRGRKGEAISSEWLSPGRDWSV